ncbi:hypothetical protein KC622_03415 [Candidatus Dojkabacteria bacterium]|uniref:Uncharacterized protein n=1 Tax=Candidatus Dojkabacteria bacterium TaxID=2099670 RepID=A0A955I2E8_9BACT|nr:hypothetical protein [Candidatus Dojkabacteria bacterium]
MDSLYKKYIKLIDMSLGDSVTLVTKHMLFTTSLPKLLVLISAHSKIGEVISKDINSEFLEENFEAVLEWIMSELEFIYDKYSQSTKLNREIVIGILKGDSDEVQHLNVRV